jgi:hypothetical protein
VQGRRIDRDSRTRVEVLNGREKDGFEAAKKSNAGFSGTSMTFSDKLLIHRIKR